MEKNTEASGGEDWETYARKVLEEARREGLAAQPVLRSMHAVMFVSYSQGRRRKKRKHPRVIILFQYKTEECWRCWPEEGDIDSGRTPWDEWVTEIFGRAFCDRLSIQGIKPEEYLLKQVFYLLQEFRGRF